MAALLLTNIKYHFDGEENVDVERRLFSTLVYEAVITLGKGDNFDQGICKLIRHLISVDNWKDRENAIKTISVHEPEPYKGIFSFSIMLRREYNATVSGEFKIIRDLIL